MRRPIPILWASLLLLLVVVQAVSQTSNSAPPKNPAVLIAAYNQAMQAKNWSDAIASAQQLVTLKATSLNLKMLADAQLYSGSTDEALATYEQALAAAEKEKPAEGPLMSGWKDGLADIYIGKGNALLKLKRTAEAIEWYNQSAGLASKLGALTSIYAQCSTTTATRMIRRQPAASACKRTPPKPMPGSFWGRISLPMRL